MMDSQVSQVQRHKKVGNDFRSGTSGLQQGGAGLEQVLDGESGPLHRLHPWPTRAHRLFVICRQSSLVTKADQQSSFLEDSAPPLTATATPKIGQTSQAAYPPRHFVQTNHQLSSGQKANDVTSKTITASVARQPHSPDAEEPHAAADWPWLTCAVVDNCLLHYFLHTWPLYAELMRNQARGEQLKKHWGSLPSPHMDWLQPQRGHAFGLRPMTVIFKAVQWHQL
ncbi:hypothetical protein IWZ00DRAFT_218043 [Phyllosticta capitalensis]|uniref:Uncharacterized protein n=1 Tax=Phyllosticta capitalensis TaxID=121624 RepID=A0ABR1YSB3_9PEZI